MRGAANGAVNYIVFLKKSGMADGAFPSAENIFHAVSSRIYYSYLDFNPKLWIIQHYLNNKIKYCFLDAAWFAIFPEEYLNFAGRFKSLMEGEPRQCEKMQVSE